MAKRIISLVLGLGLFAMLAGVVYAVTVNDPLAGGQWALRNIGAHSAWDVSKSASWVNIAIVDTGIQGSHPDLQGKVVKTRNFSTDGNSADNFDHGTSVAGVAAAKTDNGVGVAGVGWNATLFNVKVGGGQGATAPMDRMVRAIRWAADNGAEVINISYSYKYSTLELQSAVNYAWNKGAVIIATAGNAGSTAREYPAAYNNVIGVASLTRDGALSQNSNRGDWVSMAAPGQYVKAPITNGGYRDRSGTSFAAPQVSGVAGLMWTVAKDKNGNGKVNDDIARCIKDTAWSMYGVQDGRLNANAAVRCVR